MRPIIFKLFLLVLFLGATILTVKGQTCTGSLGDPVINETFGAGKVPGIGPPLPAGVTNYTYSDSVCAVNGSYTIATTSGPVSCWGTWHVLPADHTGDPNGYMMIVDASYEPGIFYTKTVAGNQLCSNTTYEFAAWIANIMALSPATTDFIQPNITFTITKTDGTLLAPPYNTGNIKETPQGTLDSLWNQYGTYFTTPSDGSDIVVTMTNNAPGGNGNDLILDDITFRPCGPVIQTGFGVATGPANASLCAGSDTTVALSASQTGYNNPQYQWQANINSAGWVDLGGETADTLNKSFVNAAPGNYQYRLGVSNGTATALSCRIYSRPLIVQVNPLPAAPAITAAAVCGCRALKPNEFCPGDSILFGDKNNAADSIKTWLWDFGDNTTSILQNPVHLYAGPGTYNVTLTVTNVNGCTSDTSQTIYIDRKPLAAFTASAPDCAAQNITFTDNSTTADGKIIKWIWAYGDGKTDTLASNSPVSHIYANAGTDTVKLTVVTDGGCTGISGGQAVTVNPLPAVDFDLPAICLNDAYAQFTDKTTFGGSTGPGAAYLWDFGDTASTAENPDTSSQKNPKHKYLHTGNYNVTLTVTTLNGCIVSKTLPFTVNGDTPVAAFLVENSNNLCSSDPVVFDDQSTVDFGGITKIVWYFDFNNLPQDTVVFLKDSIPADLKFYHNYGLFSSPLTKSYTVRMDVYSGITCTSTTQQNITVNANPAVSLSSVGPICQNTPPVQIVQNTNGFTGTAVFTGTGVSPNGLFDPSISGTGTFTVGYTFTAQNGCSYSNSQQVIVKPAPMVSVVPNLILLEGGQITLPAAASGDSLSYQWAPSTGLNQDNILNPIATPSNNTTYKLVVTNAEGCTSATEVTVNLLKFPVIPTAFTPNGDGVNDTWDIKYLSEYTNNTVDIYNRYGEKVFSSAGYGVPWDGKHNGVDLPQGTYYYIINPKNGRKIISGSVTIIR